MNAIIEDLKLHRDMLNVQLENAKRQNLFSQVSFLEGFREALTMCIEQAEEDQPSTMDLGLQSGMDFILSRGK